MKQIQTVDLTISQLTADLNNGLSWLAKDDTGLGSIQDKYEATEMQILTIKKHPKLVNVEQIKHFFSIIDDTITTDKDMNDEDVVGRPSEEEKKTYYPKEDLDQYTISPPPTEEEIQLP